jgi:hypothetical protein
MNLGTGCRVTVQGLQSAAAQHRNGSTGKVQAFDASSGRYTVLLEDGSTLALKPSNVKPSNLFDSSTAPNTASSAAPSAVPGAAPSSGGDGGACDTIFAWSGRRIELRGLVGAAELNGREGVVEGGVDGATGRYSVRLSARGGDAERTLSVKEANMQLAPEAAQLAAAAGTGASAAGAGTPVDSTTSGMFMGHGERPTAMPARPGPFKKGYDWREVGVGQTLPRGLEVWQSLEAGIPTIARIPRKWRLEVAVASGCGGQVDDAGPSTLRIDVERYTTMAEVVALLEGEHPVFKATALKERKVGEGAAEGAAVAAAAAFKAAAAAAWAGRRLTVSVDGKPCADAGASAEKAVLFGAAVSCCAV